MGWNLEVTAVRTDELHDAIPDVFVRTDTTMGFEDATSARRGPDLCATKVGDWVFVIDVYGRLSEVSDHLAEASASTDLHVVHIADNPVIVHYRDGQQVLEARGLDACMEVDPDAVEDGETCAMRRLRMATGVAFGGDELWEAEFTLYTL